MVFLHKRNLILSFLALFLCFGCASSPDVKSRSGASEEFQTGQQIHNQILSEYYTYTDPKVTKYIEEVGDNIAAHSKRKDLFYTFTILYDSKIYARSAPGGFIYITTGFLDFLENEAQLAAVLGHEIAQSQFIDPRLNPFRKAMRSMTQTGAMIAPMFGQIGALATLGLLAVDYAVGSSEPDHDEKAIQSDEMAMEYMVASGYDPQAFINLQMKFLTSPPSTLPLFYDYYQMRPITEERVAAFEKTFRELDLEGKILTTAPEKYQSRVKGVKQIYIQGT